MLLLQVCPPPPKKKIMKNKQRFMACFAWSKLEKNLNQIHDLVISSSYRTFWAYITLIRDKPKIISHYEYRYLNFAWNVRFSKLLWQLKNPNKLPKSSSRISDFHRKNYLQGHNNMELVKKYLEENEHIQI